MACANRWRVLALWALGALTGCFESSVTPSSTTDPSNTPCIPGETQMCLCVGGQDGVQVCNAEGTGYEACECVGASNTSSMTSATSDGDGSTTGMRPDDTGVDTGTDNTGPVDDSTSDTSVKLDMGGPPPDGAYGPCEECNEMEICVGGQMQPSGVCGVLCNGDADCPSPPGGQDIAPECQPVNGDGTMVCVLPCNNGEGCPDGMICDVGVCKWPM